MRPTATSKSPATPLGVVRRHRCLGTQVDDRLLFGSGARYVRGMG
jgi:hypothetical protein